MAAGIHISISAEKLFTVGGLDVTNSMLTSVIVSLILISFAFLVKHKLKNTSKPSGLQNFVEMIIESLHSLVHGVTGDLKKTRLFFPFISTFFLVILLNNWIELIPGVGTIMFLVDENPPAQQIEENTKPTKELNEQGSVFITPVLANEETTADTNKEVEKTTTKNESHGESSKELTPVPLFRPGTADVNTTAALALISVLATQIFGIKYLKLGYFKKFINTTSPIMFFVGILEIVSEFAKIISFLFRLFGNIFAGEVLLAVMAFLLPLIAPIPFYGLELFVGFIQALVFSMLTLVFFNMATQGHEEH